MTTKNAREIIVERYTPSSAAAWDDFVERSKNATFLHKRCYMEYHADRFKDTSLVLRRGAEIISLLPAHETGGGIASHNGLTYGGFLVSERMTTPLMLECFDAVRKWLASRNVRTFYYKTIPHIYHRLPAEEDRYALFRHNAVLVRRDLLSTIDMARRPMPQERRRRGAAKALQKGVSVQENADWEGFWQLLEGHLAARYHTRPVHSFLEIRHLQRNFPLCIRLFTAWDPAGSLLGGVVIYETDEVAHLQYAAATAEGFACGCLDRLFLHLLDEVFVDKRWFDFGNSTELEGRWLNDGLINQKEGFGGRAVAHDHYEILI